MISIRPRIVVPLCALSTALWVGTALAASQSFQVPLTATQGVPPVETGGKGMADLTYDPGTRVVTWNITYSGLSGPATMAHFHGPAPVGNDVAVATVRLVGAASAPAGTASATWPSDVTMLPPLVPIAVGDPGATTATAPCSMRNWTGSVRPSTRPMSCPVWMFFSCDPLETTITSAPSWASRSASARPWPRAARRGV